MKLLITFILLNIFNVILQTIKSIATVRCGKWGASLINAVAFGLYTVVLVYTNADFPLWEKVIIVALSNLIGVFVVKMIEEKARKAKMWEIKATVPKESASAFNGSIKAAGIPYNYIDIDKWVIFNAYCATCEQSETLKKILDTYEVKYFVSETKTL